MACFAFDLSVGVRATKDWVNELILSVKEPALKRSYGLTKSRQNQSVVKFHCDEARMKSLLRRLKNIGMVSEKLYRNTLI